MKKVAVEALFVMGPRCCAILGTCAKRKLDPPRKSGDEGTWRMGKRARSAKLVVKYGKVYFSRWWVGFYKNHQFVMGRFVYVYIYTYIWRRRMLLASIKQLMIFIQPTTHRGKET